MTTLKKVVDGFVCQREYDQATLSRLGFWVEQLGDMELSAITDEDVDAALVHLAERGRLHAGRNLPTTQLGQPLAGSTLNRYVSQLGSVFKYARRLRLLPRSHIPPTKGVEKVPEASSHERYFRPEEVERLLKVAPLVDRQWGRMAALIVLAYHTGLRKMNLLNLKWGDIDLDARTAKVARTKNGEPMVAVLSLEATKALRQLPGKDPDTLVFGNKKGRPYNIRRLWLKICEEANIHDRTFHSLRHGCGHALAQAGVNQASIMALMGHKSFASSARYMHANAEDKRRVIDSVFDR